ncbi:hypothetical protein BDW68DRAFT_152324 [Aspergillus falconensis]
MTFPLSCSGHSHCSNTADENICRKTLVAPPTNATMATATSNGDAGPCAQPGRGSLSQVRSVIDSHSQEWGYSRSQQRKKAIYVDTRDRSMLAAIKQSIQTKD